MNQRLRLGFASALNLSTYFLFQLFIIKSLGAGPETDAFVASTTVPQLVIAVIGGSIGYVLVPILSTRTAGARRHDAWAFIYMLGSIFCLLSLALTLLLPYWLPFTVPGFNTAQKQLCEQLTFIQLIGMPLNAVIAVQLANRAAEGQFVKAELTQFFANCISIALLAVLIPQHGVLAAAWISLLRVALQSVGLFQGLGLPMRPAGVRELMRTPLTRIKPLLLGSAYYRTEPAVDRYLLSGAQGGALTLYFLVDQIFSGASQLLNKVIVAPAIPRLSQHFDRREIDQFAALYYRTVWRVLVPAVVLLAAFIVPIAFIAHAQPGWMNTSFDQWSQLWWLMLALGGCLIGGACGNIASGAFYACGDTLTPTRMTLVTYSIFIPCKLLAFQYWGLTGLAVVASVYSMNNFLLLVLLLRRKLKRSVSGTSQNR